jgi:hypothetical protein
LNFEDRQGLLGDQEVPAPFADDADPGYQPAVEAG